LNVTMERGGVGENGSTKKLASTSRRKETRACIIGFKPRKKKSHPARPPTKG